MMGKITDNFKKHTTNNPLQKWLIEQFYKNLFDLAKTIHPQSILDVGCGEGFTLSRLKEKGIGKNLEGIDFLDTAIALGTKRYPELTLKQANIYDLPYKENSFDLVICTEVFEHLEKPSEALEEIVRVSKKHLLLSVPNEPFFMGANFLRGKNWSRFGNDIEHIQHWTMHGFEQFVSQEKVKIVKRRYPFPWIMLLIDKV